jgi:RNA polymerase sigma-70 factor (ECF subfamily)
LQSIKTQQPASELKLVESLRQKDRSAYTLLYDNYSAALYGVILKVVRVPEMAQDVLQDTFVKIWRGIATYESAKGTLFTWMLNIARNTAIDKIRSAEYKQFTLSDTFKSKYVDIKHSESPVIDQIGLNQIVQCLDIEQQEVIEIIYFQGYSHTEAAEALNLPLGTVKTRVRIALRELRKLFGI